MRKLLATILMALVLAVPVGAMADTTVIGVPPSPVAGDFIPDTDNAYDLGSSNAAWQKGYFHDIQALGDLDLASDTGKLTLGADQDFKIYHTGLAGFVYNYTGMLNIGVPTTGKEVRLYVPDGAGGFANGLVAKQDGILLYHNNTLTAKTVVGGWNITALAAAPATPISGTFYIADGVNWDPAAKAGGVPYPVFYDGSAYNALY